MAIVPNKRMKTPIKTPILRTVDFKHHSNISEMKCVNFVNCFSNQRINFSKIFFPVICSNFPKRDDNQGTIVNDDNNDNKVAITTVTQN